MIMGFTGTRGETLANGRYGGMCIKQKNEVSRFLKENKGEITEVHHGGCVGSDKQFHDMCLALGLKIIVHPGYSTRNPGDKRYRAELEGNYSEMSARPYYSRNRDIVRTCDVLIATPREAEGSGNGGTWYTIEYAKGLNKPVITFLPHASSFVNSDK